MRLHSRRPNSAHELSRHCRLGSRRRLVLFVRKPRRRIPTGGTKAGASQGHSGWTCGLPAPGLLWRTCNIPKEHAPVGSAKSKTQG